MIEPIDAVITWVDGYDLAHQEKLKAYLARRGIQRPIAAAPTRFNQCGELDYCVLSLKRYAPWIRTIFIVTDAQHPAILSKLANTPWGEKIQLVDHRDIFFDFENHLPTFNSLSIESVLWRIKDLSPRFIYLNDDCALIRPVHYGDFFRNQQSVLRGQWKKQNAQKWWSVCKKFIYGMLQKRYQEKENEHRQLQEKSALLAGFSKHFFHLPHAPFAVHKETFSHFFDGHPSLLEANIRHALRDPEQFWAMSLAQHLDIKNKQATIDNHLQSVYLNGAHHSSKKISKRLKKAENNPEAAFICLQSMDMASESTRNMIFNWLDERI